MLDRLALAVRLLPALPAFLLRPGGRTSVADRIEKRARDDPDGIFLLFEDRQVRYAELEAEANRVAHWGLGLGLGPGDVVALHMENRPEYVFVWAGLAKLGVTTALLNTNLTGRALAHALETARTRTIVVGSECLERMRSVGSEIADGLQVWELRDPSAEAEPPKQAHDLDAALASQPTTAPDPSVRDELRTGDDLFYIYTSGTTGLPKAARFSHLRFLAAGELIAVALGLRKSDVHYCALPLYHSAGGVMVVSSVLAVGATLALRRRFSASAFWDDVRRTRATCFQYIGEFCRYLMNQPERPDDRDHSIQVAVGNGLRTDIWEAFQQRFGIDRIVEFYGATEGNTALINLENKVGSVGRLPFRVLDNARLARFDVDSESHVRDAKGFCVACAPGEVGELLGAIPNRDDRTQGRFEGYTSKEASDKKVLRDAFQEGDAWFRSGDLLRQDRDGFYYFVDRIGDTFRWKGENVSTQEVAELLTGFPGLAMVNVYGVRIEGMDGRAGMAAIQPESPNTFDPAAFYRFVDEALPRYAAPVFLRLIGEAEVTGTFKLRKVVLQDEGFDPGRITDPLFLRDDSAKAFIPLDPDLAHAIRSGTRKL